ncbi:hypothetical protein ACPF8X_02235 [Streptomyces sp. G35A]
MVAITDTATAIGRRDIAALLLGFTLAAAPNCGCSTGPTSRRA